MNSYVLISVSDKTNIEIIASHYIEAGYHILSTGGSYKYLIDRLPEYREKIVKLSDVTGFPEILDGRVKTLHPKIYGSLLCDLEKQSHIQQCEEHQIPDIKTVIVNLYPFHKTTLDSQSSHSDIIENIDIGGVTLIRAAAKNYKYITVIVDPNDYGDVINNMSSITTDYRHYLAGKAFKIISEYDSHISNYFNTQESKSNSTPESYSRNYQLSQELKYGCNPYQKKAGIYTISENNPFQILNGKLGYINILDAIYSWQLVQELSQCLEIECAASYKHTSPAGVGTAKPLSNQLHYMYDIPHNKDLSPLATAFIRARNTDPMSSFGDFIALSHTVDECTALEIKKVISDGVVAPGYTPEALEILKEKRKGNYLILQVDPSYQNNQDVEIREIFGMSLVQQVNNYRINKQTIGKIVTNNSDKNKLDEALNFSNSIDDLIIANISLKYAQSNNVAFAHDGQLIGLAAGQQNRVDCVRLAGEKAKMWWLRRHPKVLALRSVFKPEVKKQDRINAIIRYIHGKFTDEEYDYWLSLFTELPEILTQQDKDEFVKENIVSSLASDAFFPFRDNIDVAAQYGVKNIIQPGGSQADQAVIDACNLYGISMVFTDSRLFYH